MNGGGRGRPDDRQPERQARGRPRSRIRSGRPVVRTRQRLAASSPGRRDRPAGQSARRIVTTATSGIRIAELGLDDRRDHRVDRGPLRVVAPQLAQGEQDEDDAERIDLAPDDAVEPEDRVEDSHEGRREGEPVATAELADHRPGEPADGEVGQDRRDLDEVPDAAEQRSRRSRRATGRRGSRGCSRGRTGGRRSPTGRSWRGRPPRTGTLRGRRRNRSRAGAVR